MSLIKFGLISDIDIHGSRNSLSLSLCLSLFLFLSLFPSLCHSLIKKKGREPVIRRISKALNSFLGSKFIGNSLDRFETKYLVLNDLSYCRHVVSNFGQKSVRHLLKVSIHNIMHLCTKKAA
jgi:hypothetical protein